MMNTIPTRIWEMCDAARHPAPLVASAIVLARRPAPLVVSATVVARRPWRLRPAPAATPRRSPSADRVSAGSGSPPRVLIRRLSARTHASPPMHAQG